MNSIYFYTDIQTPRCQWIASEFLGQWGLYFFFEKNINEFQAAKGIKINYSQTAICNGEIHIIPQGLLFEKNIVPQAALESDIEAYLLAQKAIDVFAAAFYLLSRYEEYLPFEADEHGRFSAKNSVAHRLGFLQKPLIDEWRMALRGQILAQYPETKLLENPFAMCPTYDIDQAFSYKNKGFFRTFGALLKDATNKHRWRVLLGKQNDPFDTFDLLDTFHQAKNLEPIYFFLLGDWATFDKNISSQNIDFQRIIKKISKQYNIGIHPSYASNIDFLKIKKEKSRLEKITGRKVYFSRQHFLKLHFPITYRHLIDHEIAQDFSMGYADDIGFRASTAWSFFWYDLEKETITDLSIHPFQVMDVTLKSYLKLTPTEAYEAIQSLKKNMQNTGGQLVTLWHNSSFEEEWADWKAMYFSLFD